MTPAKRPLATRALAKRALAKRALGAKARGERALAEEVPGTQECLTCADLAVTAKVLRLLPDAMALVEVGEGTEVVSVALVRATVGDAILVHAREAIAVVGR